MGKKTKLHEAAERGESEELQRLLDSGAYEVNEKAEDYFNVCEEREREQVVLSYSLLLLISTLWIVYDEKQYVCIVISSDAI